MEIEKELFRQYADPEVCVKPELLSKRGGGDYAEMALGVIAALKYNRDTFAVCNVPNRGVIPFLPGDAVIETACMVNAAGAAPVSFRSFPDSVWGLVSAVKNYESLTVDAAVTGDRDKALFALLAHPLILDLDLAPADAGGDPLGQPRLPARLLPGRRGCGMILAFDLGTGGVKASLLDESGRSHGAFFQAYPTFYGPGGRHEQRPEDWWAGVCAASRSLLANSGFLSASVEAVALSGFSMTAVPLDGHDGLLMDRVPIWSGRASDRRGPALL